MLMDKVAVQVGPQRQGSCTGKFGPESDKVWNVFGTTVQACKVGNFSGHGPRGEGSDRDDTKRKESVLIGCQVLPVYSLAVELN